MGDMQPVSRIETARRSLRTARIAIAAGAAAALLALTVTVRASHPASSHHATALQTPDSLSSQADSLGFGDGGSFGSSSPGGSTGAAPQVSSGGS
jgi:hypothetical protein